MPFLAASQSNSLSNEYWQLMDFNSTGRLVIFFLTLEKAFSVLSIWRKKWSFLTLWRSDQVSNVFLCLPHWHFVDCIYFIFSSDPSLLIEGRCSMLFAGKGLLFPAIAVRLWNDLYPTSTSVDKSSIFCQ